MKKFKVSFMHMGFPVVEIIPANNKKEIIEIIAESFNTRPITIEEIRSDKK